MKEWKDPVSLTKTGTPLAIAIGRFGRVCGFTPDPPRAAAVAAVAGRLGSLPEYARKLLALVTELAYREHNDGRKRGAAYLPELHETCGLGVDEMYAVLNQLESAGFIRIEGEYPFQDVALPKVALADKPESWALMLDVARFCASEHIPLRDLIVDLRFDRLA